MAIISLPLTFNNSFWSQDYRTGLEVIFKKLEQGIAENDEIVAFVRARAVAEGQFAASLNNQPKSKAGTGFDADDGASLLMTFRGLQAEAAEHGHLHEAISTELHTLVAEPFQAWTEQYRERLEVTREKTLDSLIRDFEGHRADVEDLRQEYIEKTHRADEAEDDARFVSTEVADKYTSPTSSPRTPAHNIRKVPARQPTLSERVTQRLRGLGRSAASAMAEMTPQDPPLQVFDAETEKSLNVEPRLDKGKGKATAADLAASPPPLSPPLPKLTVTTSEPESETDVESQKVLLAGLPFTYLQISAFLRRAKSEMVLQTAEFPILGKYQDSFTGNQFADWLSEKVPDFQRDRNIVLVAAKELTSREDLLRRLGQFGNEFEDSEDAYYNFRPKAFTLGQPPSVQAETKSPLAVSPLQRIAPELAKTSGTFVDIVSKALGSSAEPPFIRRRREATLAEAEYRKAVRSLDIRRLMLEEKIEAILRDLQSWETDRLRAVKSVLLQYQGSIANLRKSYDASADRSSTLISAYNPDSDLKALIERYRTGPFRPKAYVFESITHEEGDVVFGIDLRKWAEGGWGSDEVRKDTLPPALTTLLNTLNHKYGEKDGKQDKKQDKIPAHEKRKAWIYEVPLKPVHVVREALNSIPDGQEIPEDILRKYDAPVLASVVKLWLLELEPPLGLYDAWDEFRKIYPSIGSTTKAEQSEEQRLEAVATALLKFPKIHLSVLDAVLQHLKYLIDHTEVEEEDEIYISKLALAIGRNILRPKFENERSLQDRHATMLFVDLIQHYDRLLPPTLTKKKRESDRKIPQRKRTAMIDMRMRRSNITETSDLKETTVQQYTQRTGPGSRSSISTTTGPPDSVKVLTSGQDNKTDLPPILRAGGRSSNTSPVPPPRSIAAPSPSPAFFPPPPRPPPTVGGTGFATPPPPPGFVPPPPPPPLVAGSRSQEIPTFPEPQTSYPEKINNYPSLGSISRGSYDSTSPTPSSDPPSRSSSPAVGGNRPGSVSGLRGPRTSMVTRGPRISGLPPAPGRMNSYGQQTRPQTPPSPNTNNFGGPGSRGTYNPSAHRRSGSGSGFARTMASDAEDGIL